MKMANKKWKYKTLDTFDHKGKPIRVMIPYDESGYVPEGALLKRYEEFYRKVKADRTLTALLSGNPRKNPAKAGSLTARDYDHKANIIYPAKVTPEQAARWWGDPTTSDITDIDVAGAPKYNIPSGMTEAQKKAQAKIGVIATPAEEKKIRRDIVAVYTGEDLKRFADGGVTINIRPLNPKIAGQYSTTHKKIELERGMLNRNGGLNMETLSHEGGHYLRDTDKGRLNPIVKRAVINGEKLTAVEESCTVAEQMARSNKPLKGYYDHVPVFDKNSHRWRKPTPSEIQKMAEEDWQLFTLGRGKGLKGDDALQSVCNNWEKSHISRLKYKSGNKSAYNLLADEYGIEKLRATKPTDRGATLANVGQPGKVTVAQANKVNTSTIKISNTRQATLPDTRKISSKPRTNRMGKAGGTRAGRARTKAKKR